MEDYKHKLGNLADKLKKEIPRTPIQEVLPVKPTVIIKAAEVQFNNWIPKSLLKRLKAFGVEYDQSLKDINTEALEMFLRAKSKQTKTTGNGD
jgi:hypothetical protein